MHEIDISFFRAAIIINRDAHRLQLDTQDESLEGVEEESCVNSAATSNRQHE
jgi:hypothetical protein